MLSWPSQESIKIGSLGPPEVGLTWNRDFALGILPSFDIERGTPEEGN
jgi:hypothetical protein